MEKESKTMIGSAIWNGGISGALVMRAIMVRSLHDKCHALMRQDVFSKVVRAVYGFSQEDLAAVVGCSEDLVKQIEDGNYPDDTYELSLYEDRLAGYFLLHNSAYGYDTDADDFDEHSQSFKEDVEEMWSRMTQAWDKILAPEFMRLSEELKHAIIESGKIYVG